MTDTEISYGGIGLCQNKNETKEEVGPGEEGPVQGPPPPVGGGSGTGEDPKMGCAASAQAATVPQAGVVKQTTPRQNHLHAGSIPQAPRDTASTQARVVEPTTPHDDMRPGTLRHEPSVVAAKAHAEELNRRMDKRDEINRQMQCDKETDQEILNKKLETLFDALRGPDPALMKSKLGILKEEQKKVLTDGLIALGISRRTDDFINDLLDESTEQLNTGEFTAKVKEELQISLRFLPLHMSFLVRIYHALPVG